MVKDYRDINTVMPIQVFNARIAKAAQGYLKKRKPFDEQCARMEFRDQIEMQERESERRHGFVKVDELKMDIEGLDLDKYGKEDRFEFIDDKEDVTEKFIEGTKMQVTIGHTLSYKCKPRGHGISVFIPIEEYRELNKKKE